MALNDARPGYARPGYARPGYMAAGGQALTHVVTDSTGLVDAPVTHTVAYAKTLTDGAGQTDVLTAGLAYAFAASDTSGLTDASRTPISLIPNLKVRFRAGDIVGLSDGDPVATWPSAVGTSTGSQTTSTRRPIYSSGDSDIGGRPTVTFDGTDDYLTFDGDALSMWNNIGGATVFIVGKREGSFASERTLLAVQTPTGGVARASVVHLNTTGYWRVGGRRLDNDASFDSAAGTVAADTAATIVTAQWRWADAQAELWEGGTQRAIDSAFQTAGNTSPTDAGLLHLGAHVSPTAYFGGPVAEMLMFDRTLTTAERAAVHSELRDYYNLTQPADYVAAGFSGSTVLTAGGNNLTHTATDGSGLADAVTPVTAASLGFTDQADLTDPAPTRAASFALAMTDNTGLTDRVSFAINITDNTGLTDAHTRVFSYLQTRNDPAGLSDLATSSAAMALAQTDGSGLVDSIATAAARAQANTDTTGLTDTASTATSYSLTLTESIGLVDVVSTAVSFTYAPPADTAGLTDTFAQPVARVVDTTDNPGLTDTATTAVQYDSTVSNSVGLTDSAITDFTLGSSDLTQVSTDNVGLADQVITALVAALTITDTAGSTDVFSRVSAAALTLTDSAGTTDSATPAAAIATSNTDNAGSTDTATTVTAYSLTRTDSETLADSASTVFTYTTTVVDNSGLADTTTRATSFATSSTDTAGLTDAQTQVASRILATTDSAGTTDTHSIAVARVLTVTDGAGTTDSTTTVQVISSTLTDSAGLADAYVTTLAANISLIDPVGLLDNVSIVSDVSFALTDLVGLFDDSNRQPINSLNPDAIVAASNVSGAVSAVQDDVNAPDGSSLATTGTWSVRFSFPSVGYKLQTGAGVQKFRVRGH